MSSASQPGGGRWRAWRSGLPTLAALAWRNLWRNPARSALTLAALAGSLVLLLLYLALAGGMTRQMVEHATDLSVGHLQLQRQAFTQDQDLYATLPSAWLPRLQQALPDARFAPRLYASALASTAEASAGVLVKAVAPAQERQVSRLLDRLRSGSAELADAAPDADGLTRHPVLLGAQLARQLRIGPGDELVLVGQAADASIANALFRVAGVLRPLEPAFDRSGVLMSIAAYRALMVMDQGFHQLSVRLPDVATLADDQARLQRTLDALAAEQPLDALGGPAQLRNWRQVVPALADMLQVYGSVVWLLGLVIVALAALGMVNTLLMAMHERRHEFGILRAVGMHQGWLLAMVLLESLALALLAVLLGNLLGLGLMAGPLRGGIDMSGNLPDGFDMAGMVIDPVLRLDLAPLQLAGASALVLALAMLAALLPAWRLLRLQPAAALR